MTISIPAAIVTGAVIIGIALIIGMGRGATTTTQQPTPDTNTPTDAPASVATIRSGDLVRGDVTNADVAIIEYSDSDCTYCERFHPTLKQALSEDKNLVWVYRFFPLTIHPNAYTEATALKCVADLGGNDTFWKYLDTIINVTLNPDPKSNEALTTYATADGVDAKLFKSCFANPATSKAIDADIAEAQSIGAQGTPYSIVVNLKTGKQTAIPGAYPIEDVRKAIESVR
jgi:protein-disulfide isomerase